MTVGIKVSLRGWGKQRKGPDAEQQLQCARKLVGAKIGTRSSLLVFLPIFLVTLPHDLCNPLHAGA